MLIFDLVPVLWRHAAAVILLAAVGGAAGFFTAKNQPEAWEGRATITIELENFAQSADLRADPVLGVQYADWFSNTVEGWLADPAFHEFVAGVFQKNGHEPLDFSSVKTHRQTIAVTARAPDSTEATLFSLNFPQVLAAEVAKYREKTGLPIVIGRAGSSVSKISPPAKIWAAGGVFLGLVLAAFFIAGREAGRISTRGELEDLVSAARVFGKFDPESRAWTAVQGKPIFVLPGGAAAAPGGLRVGEVSGIFDLGARDLAASVAGSRAGAIFAVVRLGQTRTDALRGVIAAAGERMVFVAFE